MDKVISEISNNGHKHVCVTGGEPLLQNNVHPLMKHLCDMDFTVSIETGGSLTIASIDPRVIVILDIKCPGSGMSHKNLWDNLSHLKAIDEVKFVIKDKDDYSYAVNVSKKYHLFERHKQVLFSPVFESLCPKELVSWILEDKLPVRLNLQTHKYIWSPETKGV